MHEQTHIQTEAAEKSKTAYVKSTATTLQRKCACGRHTIAGGECKGCKKGNEETTLQRAAKNTTPVNQAPPIVDDVLRSSGQPLDAATRAFFEPRFAHDFSHVRVHTDAKAAESARAVNALAYTVGRDVVFGAGEFAPSTYNGRRLLAHELAHTIQQSAGRQIRPASLTLAPANDSSEHEADASAEEVMQGRVPQTAPQGAFRIARKPCLPSSFCKTPIPGSASEYIQKAAELQEENEKQLKQAKKTGLAGAAPAKKRRSIELTKYARIKMPKDLTASLGAIVVNPAIGNTASAQLDSYCEFLKSRPKGVVGCMEIPESLEDEAKIYNMTASPTIGKWTRAEWEAEVLEIFAHEIEHGRFDKEPPEGTPEDDEEIMDELSELNSLLSEFPIGYRQIMNSSASTKEKQEKLHLFISARVENKYEGIRGAIYKMRCLISCEQVAEYVRVVFLKQSANWDAKMKTEILTELAAQIRDWPVPVSSIKTDGPTSVASTIEVLNFGAEIYQDLLAAKNFKTSEAELSRRLKEWFEALGHAVGIIRSELRNDSALMLKLRTAYVAAVQAAIAATAKALNLTAQDLYKSKQDLIHEWAWPGAKTK
jgi:hypothetical protein